MQVIGILWNYGLASEIQESATDGDERWKLFCGVSRLFDENIS